MTHRSVGLLALVMLTLRVQASTMHTQFGLRQLDINSYTVEAEADRVSELPGLGKPDFGLFSG